MIINLSETIKRIEREMLDKQSRCFICLEDAEIIAYPREMKDNLKERIFKFISCIQSNMRYRVALKQSKLSENVSIA